MVKMSHNYCYRSRLENLLIGVLSLKKMLFYNSEYKKKENLTSTLIIPGESF